MIIPVYKVEKYLDKCVMSVVNQTYKNLEIILVDDGSPDNCPKMCDLWAEKDSRIRVIHKENGGLSSARNAGLDAMRGEFVGFVDSDDYISPEMYGRLYDLIKSYDADLSICGHIKVDEAGNNLFNNNDSQPLIKVYSCEEVLSAFINYEFSWLSGYFGVSVNKLYCRKIFDSIRFPEGFLHEDDLTVHYILGACKRAVVTNEIFYFYLQREGSIMSQAMKSAFNPDHFNICVKIYKERSNYLTSQGMPELAERVLFKLYAMWANDLRKINYLQFRKKLNKSLLESISMLMKSKHKLRAVKLLIRLSRSVFRPYI
ncbi:MAG: glycosyltransferase [Synergistaceae bacterium]|nr:glycosyltransferase [Synergistaceae bacterium]